MLTGFDFLKEVTLRTLNNNKHYVNNTYKKHCIRCGECCSTFLPISQSDITRIADYVKSHNIQPQYHSSINQIDMICPFLNSEKSCLIYAVRPTICRVFKCNKKRINNKFVDLLKKEPLNHCNMWEVFFDDKRASPLQASFLSILRGNL